jgi:hypothetical protein
LGTALGTKTPILRLNVYPGRLKYRSKCKED